MEIHLIRHTKVDVKKGICYGSSDVPLTADYLLDFHKLNLDNNYDLIITSPLSRCIMMADYIEKPYLIDNHIAEISFGDWELKNWDEICSNEIQPWYNNYIDTRPPNGENALDFKIRINQFFEMLQNQYSDKKILVITHAGVIRMISHLVLEFPLEKLFNLNIDYGKGLRLTKNHNQFHMVGWNI